MFLGSLIEFLVPGFIGRIIEAFRENNFDGENEEGKMGVR